MLSKTNKSSNFIRLYFVLAIVFLLILIPTKKGDHYFGIGSTKFNLEVVTKQADLERGLSGRDSLPAQNGMLFEFTKDDKWGIWMKDMHFAIDIVWLDSGYKIVDFAKDVQPNSYPRVFSPNKLSRFVIELPPNTVDQLKINQKLDLHI